MAARPVPEAVAQLDLASIGDVGARQAIRALLALVEEQMRAEAADGKDARKAALRELANLEELVKQLRRPEVATPEELRTTEDPRGEAGGRQHGLLVGAGAAGGAQELAEARQAGPGAG